MAQKVQVGPFGIADMLRFKNLPATREKVIAKAPAKEINATFLINENAKKLHPDAQKMIVKEIIDHKDAQAKTFILKKEDGTPAAYFRAGQYISLLFNIGGSVVTRPYSVSSSPTWAKQGKYAVTVRENPEGFVANKILADLKVGDKVTVSDPQGNFYYEPLRDEETVIALAGGSGITPFLSMAYAIRDGIENFNLVILSGSRTKKNILFYDELKAISEECSKVKVVHVLSDEKKRGFENGFITEEIIKKYAPANAPYSLFVCGPAAMYDFVKGEAEKLGLDRKHLRLELQGVPKDVSKCPDYPPKTKSKTFQLTVSVGPQTYQIKAKASETLLCAIERAGIAAPARCRSGECGWCRSKLVSGTVYVPPSNDARRWADKETGYIHPCASYPTSDVVLEVPGSYLK